LLKHLKDLIRKNKDHSRLSNCECICHSDIENGSTHYGSDKLRKYKMEEPSIIISVNLKEASTPLLIRTIEYLNEYLAEEIKSRFK
jgi:hypothetical protein